MAYETVLLSANMLFTCLTTSPQSPIFSSAMQCSIYSPSPYRILLTCSAKTKKWHFHIFKDGAILGMHTMFECTKNYTNRTGIEWATMNWQNPSESGKFYSCTFGTTNSCNSKTQKENRLNLQPLSCWQINVPMTHRTAKLTALCVIGCSAQPQNFHFWIGFAKFIVTGSIPIRIV